MRRTHLSTAFALCLVLSLIAGLIANDAHTLKYKLKKGDKLAYKVIANMEQLIEVMGSEQTTESHSATEIELVGDEAEEGRLAYIMQVKSLTVDVSNPMLDTTLTNPPDLIGRRVRKTITEFGDQLSSTELDTATINPLLAQFASSSREFLPDLPSKELKSGVPVTVTDVDTIPGMGGKNTVTAEMEYTLQGRETVEGYDCLKVSYTGMVTIVGDGMYQGMMQFALEGDGTAEGTIYFAPKEGRLVSYESGMILELTAAFTGQQNMTVPISQTMRSTMSLMK